MSDQAHLPRSTCCGAEPVNASGLLFWLGYVDAYVAIHTNRYGPDMERSRLAAKALAGYHLGPHINKLKIDSLPIPTCIRCHKYCKTEVVTNPLCKKWEIG